MKVGGKANFEWLAAICLMNVDISKQSGKSSSLLKSYQRILIGAYDISFKMRQSSRNYLGKKSRELKWNQQFNLKKKYSPGTISIVVVIKKKVYMKSELCKLC